MVTYNICAIVMAIRFAVFEEMLSIPCFSMTINKQYSQKNEHVNNLLLFSFDILCSYLSLQSDFIVQLNIH